MGSVSILYNRSKYKVMNLENILEDIKKELSEEKNIRSVLLRGSAAMGSFIRNKSDIDLSIILDNYNFTDIQRIDQKLQKISDKSNTRIGIVYTDLKEIKLDNEIGIHFHGDKNSNYVKEIAETSKIILGDDLKYLFKNMYNFNIISTYFDASKKLATYIKNLKIDEKQAYKKGINYAFIMGKQILYMHGIYETDKKEIITKLKSKSEALGNYLEVFYKDSLNWPKVNVTFDRSVQMFNYLKTCKEYIGQEIKKKENTHNQ